jgi:putative flippase GtrA
MNIFDSTLIRFLFVGLFNTFAGLSIIFFLKWIFNFGDVSSNLIGYILGFFISFYMHQRWTYNYTGAIKKAILKYLLIVVFAYLSNLTLVIFLIDILNFNTYLAQFFGIFPYVLIVFTFGKYFVFNKE